MTPTETTVRIADIQTSDILFFDPEFTDRCYEFCRKRDIDCLPSLDDPKKLYRRDDKVRDFVEEPVASARVVSVSESIFHPTLLNRFRDNPLLFVFSADELTGVVHFSDYNRPAVSEYLYRLLSALEKALRGILVKRQLKNADLVDYFSQRVSSAGGRDKEHYKKKLAAYNRHQAESDKLSAFQTFYLTDLIDFLRVKNIMHVSDKVSDLRNMVMHAHELVNLENVNTEDFIYDFKSFEAFFGQAIALHNDYRKAINKLAFMNVA